MLVNYADIEKITGLTYKTIRNKLRAAKVNPIFAGGKGKSHFFCSHQVSLAVCHPNPEMLDYSDEYLKEKIQTEWILTISRIKGLLTELPLRISRSAKDEKEKERLFELAQNNIAWALERLDAAANL